MNPKEMAYCQNASCKNRGKMFFKDKMRVIKMGFSNTNPVKNDLVFCEDCYNKTQQDD